ncbi:unnamed protein product [Polarella glacialis]|uniref:Helicase ATP-binding domain-containing protein n=1 Tax=Polarella glacialis TaxID=89957 RepID=A0A813J8X8_POLGL|nr:unnamed protein product [Polarella glacialis]
MVAVLLQPGLGAGSPAIGHPRLVSILCLARPSRTSYLKAHQLLPGSEGQQFGRHAAAGFGVALLLAARAAASSRSRGAACRRPSSCRPLRLRLASQQTEGGAVQSADAEAQQVEEAEQLLRAFFGYETWRCEQQAVVKAVVQKQDVLVNWSTGAGKSLCYQLPAVLAWRRRRGVTVVVEPLISLMRDQVVNFNKLSASSDAPRATFLGSGQSDARMDKRALEGEFCLVYVTPEKLTEGLLLGLEQLYKSGRLELIVMDEAACISLWGHDFRPSFRNMWWVREQYPQVPFMALSASMTENMRRDISEQLCFRDPLISTLPYFRANLDITCTHKEGFAKDMARICISLLLATVVDITEIQLLKASRLCRCDVCLGRRGDWFGSVQPRDFFREARLVLEAVRVAQGLTKGRGARKEAVLKLLTARTETALVGVPQIMVERLWALRDELPFCRRTKAYVSEIFDMLYGNGYLSRQLTDNQDFRSFFWRMTDFGESALFWGRSVHLLPTMSVRKLELEREERTEMEQAQKEYANIKTRLLKRIPCYLAELRNSSSEDAPNDESDMWGWMTSMSDSMKEYAVKAGESMSMCDNVEDEDVPEGVPVVSQMEVASDAIAGAESCNESVCTLSTDPVTGLCSDLEGALLEYKQEPNLDKSEILRRYNGAGSRQHQHNAVDIYRIQGHNQGIPVLEEVKYLGDHVTANGTMHAEIVYRAYVFTAADAKQLESKLRMLRVRWVVKLWKQGPLHIWKLINGIFNFEAEAPRTPWHSQWDLDLRIWRFKHGIDGEFGGEREGFCTDTLDRLIQGPSMTTLGNGLTAVQRGLLDLLNFALKGVERYFCPRCSDESGQRGLVPSEQSAEPSPSPSLLAAESESTSFAPPPKSRSLKALIFCVKDVAMWEEGPGLVALSNGVLMPRVTLGTGGFLGLAGKEGRAAMLAALKMGYRAIDTSEMNRNLLDVAWACQKSEVPREELFIIAKIAPWSHGYERAKSAFAQQLASLHLQHVDLLLLQWPHVWDPSQMDWGINQWRRSAKWRSAQLRGSWRALEELYEQGKVRSIGVSNFTTDHLEALLKWCTVAPHVLQAESHPHWPSRSLRNLCRQMDITFQGYAPFGGQLTEKNSGLRAIDDPVVLSVAESNKLTPGQVCMQWSLCRNVCTVVKSANFGRLRENLEAQSPSQQRLSCSTLARLDELAAPNAKYGPVYWGFNDQDYLHPWRNEQELTKEADLSPSRTTESFDGEGLFPESESFDSRSRSVSPAVGRPVSRPVLSFERRSSCSREWVSRRLAPHTPTHSLTHAHMYAHAKCCA